MNKDLEKIKTVVELGILDPYLPEEEVFVVFGKYKIYSGYIVIGAKDNKQARYFAKKKNGGWLKKGKIDSIKNIKRTHRVKYDELKEQKRLPTEHGEWIELEWSI